MTAVAEDKRGPMARTEAESGGIGDERRNAARGAGTAMPPRQGVAFPQRGEHTATPVFRVAVRKDMVRVEAELPGMNPQDVRVSVAEGTLTLRGLHCMYGVIERAVSLPRQVRAEAMRVKLERSQLQIELPLEAEAPNGQ